MTLWTAQLHRSANSPRNAARFTQTRRGITSAAEELEQRGDGSSLKPSSSRIGTSRKAHVSRRSLPLWTAVGSTSVKRRRSMMSPASTSLRAARSPRSGLSSASRSTIRSACGHEDDLGGRGPGRRGLEPPTIRSRSPATVPVTVGQLVDERGELVAGRAPAPRRGRRRRRRRRPARPAGRRGRRRRSAASSMRRLRVAPRPPRPSAPASRAGEVVGGDRADDEAACSASCSTSGWVSVSVISSPDARNGPALGVEASSGKTRSTKYSPSSEVRRITARVPTGCRGRRRWTARPRPGSRRGGPPPRCRSRRWTSARCGPR